MSAMEQSFTIEESGAKRWGPMVDSNVQGLVETQITVMLLDSSVIFRLSVLSFITLLLL